MYKKILSLLVGIGIMSTVNSANATVINFDDIYGNVQVTNQYSSLGVTFYQTYELDSWDPTYVPPKYSGDHAVFSGNNNSSYIVFNNDITSFSLLGVAANYSLNLDFYDANMNMVQQYSQYMPLNTWTLASVDLTNLGVRGVAIYDHGGTYGYDDVTFSSNTVPEPSTLLLVGSGIIGLAGLTRFRKQFKML